MPFIRAFVFIFEHLYWKPPMLKKGYQKKLHLVEFETVIKVVAVNMTLTLCPKLFHFTSISFRTKF